MQKLRHYSILLFVLFSVYSFAQTPQGINYQGVARDNNGTALPNKTISVLFEIKNNNTNPVFSEQHSGITTNQLGLFSLVIGSKNNVQFNNINWSAGNLFIQVSMDINGGSNFLPVGSGLPLQSVPYAMHAESVPAAFSNSVLTIGKQSFTLSLASSTVDIQGGSNISIGGTYPNYTISSSPTLSLLPPNTLSISGGNSIDITPTVSINGNTLSIGNTTNAVTLPSTTFTNSGAVTITTLTPHSFSINVPATDIAVTSTANTLSVTNMGTNSVSINIPSVAITSGTTGNVNVMGTYPNYTIDSAPTLTLIGNQLSIINGGGPPQTIPTSGTIAAVTTSMVGTGIAVVSPTAGNFFTVNVTPPSFTNSGPSTITGTYPNYTINSQASTTYTNGTGISITSGSIITNTAPDITPTIALTTTAAIAASVVSTGSSFSLNVPPPTFTNAGPTTITGTYPNFTVNSSASALTGTGTGVSSVTTSGSNFTVNVPSPTLSSSGNSITLTQGTVVTTASVSSSVNGSVTGGIATVTNSANNFTLNVPSPVLSSSGNSVTITQGTVVTTATVPVASNATVSPAGTGIANVTNPATNSFVVNVPSPALSSTGNSVTLTQGTVVTTATVPAATVSPAGTGIASVTNPSTNSFVVNVPSPALSSTGNSITLTQGTVVTTASVSSSVNGSVTGGIATVTNSANNFTLNVPSPVLSSTGNSVTITQGTVVTTATVPVASNATVSPAGTGIANVTNPATNSFVVNVPGPVLTSSGNSVTITQGTVVTTATVPLASNATVSPAGTGIANVTNPATNSFVVNVPSPALSSTGNSITLTQGTVVTTASVSSSVNGSVTGGIATVTNSTNNFTLNVPSPVLSSSGNSVTITQGTVVTTATVPVASNATVSPAGTGIASVTNPATNSFVVNVPSPALSSSGNSITLTQGTVVTTASVSSSVNGSVTGGIATVTNSANNFTLNVPSPVLSSSGNSVTITQGTVVTTATVPVASNATVSPAGTGIANVTNPATNSFVVNVPGPVLTSSGNSVTITQGTVVTTATVPVASNATVSPAGTGIANVTNPATNSFVVNVPSPALSSTGNSITLTQGTVVTTASVSSSVNGSVTGGIATLTNTANNFTLNVPSPALSSTGNSVTLTQGTVVTTASIPATTVSPAGTGIASVTNPSTNSFVVNVPSPALSSTSNSITLTQGTVVTTATVPAAITPSIAITTTGTGAAAVTSVGSSFSINVPAPIFSNTGQNIITGTYPNFSVNTPTIANTSVALSTTAAAGPSLAVIGTNSFNINIPPALPQTSITQSGAALVTSLGTNSFNVNVPQTSVAVTSTSNVLGISSAGTNSFNINIPSGSNAWSLGGNASTSSATDYIGTSDAQPLVLKTNATERMRVSSTGNIGIGTSAPTATLQVNGTTRLVDGTQAADKVLTSDASGNASWQNSSRNTAFSAYAFASQTLFNITTQQITFGSEDFDSGNNFAGNQYVAPSAGVYQFHATVTWAPLNSFTFGNGIIMLYKNGTLYRSNYMGLLTSPIINSLSIDVTMSLNASDIITIYVYHSTGFTESTYILGVGPYTYFSGYRLY